MRTILLALFAFGLFLAPSPSRAQPAACILETIAGGEDASIGDGGMAVDAELIPSRIAYGPDGSLYISEYTHFTIRRVLPNGIIERFAGNGKGGYSPDGTPAKEASISPVHLAFGPDGDLFFTDRSRVRKISDGKVVTVAGNGIDEYSGDGEPAGDAGIGLNPQIAVAGDGSVLIADPDHYRVRRVSSNGIIDTIAGTPPGDSPNAATGDGGPARDAVIGRPYALAAGLDGSIYVAGYFTTGTAVRRILPNGTIEAHSSLKGTIRALAFHPDGTLMGLAGSDIRHYSPQEGWLPGSGNFSSFAVSPSSTLAAVPLGGIQVVAVDGEETTPLAGVGGEAPLHGEGGPASLAYVASAAAISVANDGSIYYFDLGLGRLRRFAPGGTMTHIAPEAGIGAIRRLAVAEDGVVYALRPNPSGSRGLWAIAPDGTVSNGPSIFTPFPGQGAVDELTDVAIDDQGNIIVSSLDGYSNYFEIAGSPSSRVMVDDYSVNQFDFAPDGRMFVGSFSSDWFWLSLDGQMEPIAGLTGFEGGAFRPSAVAVGPDGSLYWSNTSAIWRMLPNQNIDRIAGGDETGYAGQGGPAKDAQFQRVDDMNFGPDGHLYIADFDRIHRITSPGECPSAGPRAKIATNGVVNGADYRRVSPGAVFALFGDRVGPNELAGAVLGQDGKLPTQLGGVRVLFDGVPAPLIFASNGQVNGIVPFQTTAMLRQDGSSSSYVWLSDDRVSAVVERDGKSSEPVLVTTWESWPGIFTLDSSGGGAGAFLDAEDVLIGPDNPATPGSVIVMWATGAGLTDPVPEDGTINNGPVYPQPLLPLTVEIGGLPATIEYAGAAPGLAAGIIQINVRIPEDLTQTGDVPVRLFVDQPLNLVGPASPTVYVETNQ